MHEEWKFFKICQVTSRLELHCIPCSYLLTKTLNSLANYHLQVILIRSYMNNGRFKLSHIEPLPSRRTMNQKIISKSFFFIHPYFLDITVGGKRKGGSSDGCPGVSSGAHYHLL